MMIIKKNEMIISEKIRICAEIEDIEISTSNW